MITIADIYPEWSCTRGYPTTDPCNWRGLSCSEGSIQKLNLYNLGIHGIFPMEYDWTNLTYVDMSFNYLRSSISPTIGKLSKLGHLNLANNLITSSIPSSIGLLRSLSYLSLFSNLLSSSIPPTISLLTNLAAFDVYNNLLTGSIPVGIGDLKNVLDMEIDHNSLTSSIPTSIGDLVSVQYLSMNNNLFTSTIPTTLGKLFRANYISLQSNSLISSIPDSFDHMDQLVVMILADNSLTGIPPQSLCASPTTAGVYLSNNSFMCYSYCQLDADWQDTNQLYRCQDFQDQALFDLDNNLGITKALSKIATSTTYHFMTSSQTHYSFYNHTAFQLIIEMDFINTHIYLPCLMFQVCADPSCNTILRIFDNNDLSPQTIKGNQFYFYCPLCSYCTGWTYSFYVTAFLRLDSTWVFDSTPPYLSVSDNLTYSGGSPTSTYARGLCQNPWSGVSCKHGLVTSLSLSGLGLSGSLPTSIGTLTGLTSLDLAANGITGTIPTSIAHLTALNLLLLQTNQLAGTLPSSLQRLSNLVFANFGFNRLDGSIPSYFAYMSDLALLYLDGNEFAGEVSSTICEAVKNRSFTITIINNPYLTCYQKECWGSRGVDVGNNRSVGAVELSQRHFDARLQVCAPTQSPTFAPTTIPTPFPTPSTIPSSTPLLSAGGIIGIVLAAAVILASFAIVEYYRRYQSARAVLNRKRLDRLNELPVHRALLEIPVGGIYDEDDNGVTALRGPAILRQNSRMFFSLERDNLDLSERAGRSVLEVVLPVIERYGDTTATLLDFDNKTALDIALERIPIVLGTDKGSQSHREESGKNGAWYNLPLWFCGSRTSIDSVVNEESVSETAATKQRIGDYAAIVCALVQQQLPPGVTFQDNPFHIKQTHGSGKGGIVREERSGTTPRMHRRPLHDNRTPLGAIPCSNSTSAILLDGEEKKIDCENAQLQLQHDSLQTRRPHHPSATSSAFSGGEHFLSHNPFAQPQLQVDVQQALDRPRMEEEKNVTLPRVDTFAWTRVVERDDDVCVEVVRRILDLYPAKAGLLASTVDEKGRVARDIAGHRCKNMILKKLYLHSRYIRFAFIQLSIC